MMVMGAVLSFLVITILLKNKFTHNLKNMAINYPTSLDDFSNPQSTDTMASPSHAQQHSDMNDAIEAVQAKVGINSSADTDSLDYKVAQLQNGGTFSETTAKTTPVDADTMPINDSASSNVLKKVTWANIKVTLKTYFDTLYQAVGSYLSNVSEDTTPSLGGDLAVGDNRVDLDTLPATNQTAVGMTTKALQSSGTIAIMTLVYLNSSSKWANTDADAEATTAGMLGLTLEAGTTDTVMRVALPGSFITNTSWSWTPQVPLYVSTTTGEMTETAPSGSGDVVRIVGYAVSATQIWFNPSDEYSVIT